jgi:hypothetical protein
VRADEFSGFLFHIVSHVVVPGSFAEVCVKARAVNSNADDDRFYELLNDCLIEKKLQEQQDADVVLVPGEKDNIVTDERYFTDIDLSDNEDRTIRYNPEDFIEAGLWR